MTQSRVGTSILVVGLATVALLASPQARQTNGRATGSAVRPGPDILYAAPATSTQLENTGV